MSDPEMGRVDRIISSMVPSRVTEFNELIERYFTCQSFRAATNAGLIKYVGQIGGGIESRLQNYWEFYGSRLPRIFWPKCLQAETSHEPLAWTVTRAGRPRISFWLFASIQHSCLLIAHAGRNRREQQLPGLETHGWGTPCLGLWLRLLNSEKPLSPGLVTFRGAKRFFALTPLSLAKWRRFYRL
jgi:hypothetical protein